ncbi:hypothetical protein Poly30_21060 [Planctomycetes bacterium Poly30]|uniref:Uncharacterized protein n=2 Tax=Saltatorellus ferox TaxID=2528018 RepID=A0A518ER71_9BACT|nr:hypothetical protein Poly30_21060 [Planctomycetes bacterium Poly30]
MSPARSSRIWLSLGLVAAGALLASTSALAQGSDSCASAQGITGTGQYFFDNSVATVDGVDNGCNMGRDVWFRWTAPASATFTLSTCGGTTVDSALAVYVDNGCPNGMPLACGDDQCGLQSSAAFGATAGQDYLIRLGTWVSAGSGGTGFLTIQAGGTLGGCVDPSVGANVVAGDLDEAVAYGDVGGVSSYSLAITACNVGDEEILWVSGHGDHPVVGQNLYRLENGRFEQLGAAWVKHGFAALQRDLCCTCIPSASISALGVGCSDPYGASLNGSQQTLAPRGEVDPFTGVSSWPPGAATGVPAPSGILDRRLQVPTDAMDPALHPNALYFGEAIYAAPDDALNGHGFDNASYRPYQRTGATVQGAYVLAPTSVTERGVPALAAWAQSDPTVRLEEVRIPGEGAFWVASHARALGGGRYRYSYAIFNVNSSRGGAALAVPAGTQPGAFDMAFPRAHSGDPRSNAPWGASQVGDRVVWSAPQFQIDPNANAILWGTTYSFFFESSSPPVDAQGTLVLFRSQGGPPSVQLPIRAPRAPGAPTTSIECTPVANSGGTAGHLLPGAFSAAGNTLGLTATGLPAGSLGYVLTSRTPGFSAFPGGSSGNLCLAGSIGRYVGANARAASAAGAFSVTANLSALPQPLGPVAVQPGDTWYFQCWHRDQGPTGPTSNFTASLSVRF